MYFSSYKLKQDFVSVLQELNYVTCTQIQELSLPLALKGKSLICKSATGSGKTHAFLIPIIEQLDPNFIGVQALILVPTTELVLQVGSFLSQIEAKYPTFKTVMLSSIRDKEESINKLKNATLPSIVIASPGRAKDVFLESKKPFAYKIRTLVFDEADMLFEDSYIEDVSLIFKELNPTQTLVFTATMKEHRIAEIKKWLHINTVLETNEIQTASSVKHQLVSIRHLSKERALELYLEKEKPFFALVFCSSKKEIEKIYNYFIDLGIDSILITGGAESRQRKALLKRLAKGDIHLIFASDVASRGIDFQDVSHVISLDIPLDTDYYYHRAGRSGRIGKPGTSVLFVKEEKTPRLAKLLDNIKFEKLILKEDGLKEIKERKNRPHRKNEELAKEIRLQLRKSKSKVKPGYKKKRKIAIEKAKKIHKKKIIRQNIIERKKKGTFKE